MAKKIKIITLIFLILTLISWGIFYFLNDSVLPMAITFSVFAYHLLMRLCVGFCVNSVMHNRANYDNIWFKSKKFEKKIYKILKVKLWKNKLPTYDKNSFDIKNSGFDKVLGAMCQAEIVHEINAVLSFVPIIFSKFFGALPVFLITSILASMIDLIFVIVQRYNRPRLIKIKKHKQEKRQR